jgi:hypothetical protein
LLTNNFWRGDRRKHAKAGSINPERKCQIGFLDAQLEGAQHGLRITGSNGPHNCHRANEEVVLDAGFAELADP